MPNTVEMRKVKENIGMGDKKRSTKGVSPHLFHLFGAILLCLIVCVALIVVSGLALYVYPNFKDRRALEKCKNEEDVVAYFQREPEIVYRSLDQMTYHGWKVPARPITNKVLVYTRTATRYYIYIDGNGNVEYVYRSSS